MKFKLTIIIVNWNTKQLTLDCLKSIYDNDMGTDWKIVVVDNGSEDNSAEEIKNQYPETEIIKNFQNIGFAAANNQVLRRNDSSYYLLLNSDTYVIGDALIKSLEYVKSNKSIGAMGCRVLNENKSLQYTCSKFPSVFGKILQIFQSSKLLGNNYHSHELMTNWKRDCIKEVDVISGCFFLVNNETICDVGVLDEDFFFFGEETDWCYRMKAKGWKLMFNPVGEIVHYGSSSAKKLNYKRDLMLTNALIRFILKNKGPLSAIGMYLVLFIFNISRLITWSIKSLVHNSDLNTQRTKLFLNCVLKYHKAWPKK